ncbi:MAG: molecular chaperone DnaK [Acidobacteriota bacterium]|jgi:molecular chaperone DnaK
MGRMIGIDLGTTNCCVAYMEGGKATVIPGADGARTVPSIVGFTEKGDRLVGQIAKRQMVTNPTHTVYAVKRLIGRKATDSEVGKARDYLPYELSAAPNGDLRVRVRGRDYSPPEISAIVLARLKDMAEEHLGEEVDEAVITVPAYFNDSQRQATKDAGRIAGLQVRRILNEPTAASLAYGLDRAEEMKIAVYDLGGGTFDISILRLSEGVFEVLATSGDTFLGGEDFDQRIVSWLLEQFQAAHGIDLSGDRLAMQRLKEAAEKAKIELSSVQEFTINLPFISADEGGPKHLNVNLTRTAFEELIADLVERTKQPCEDALRLASLKPEEVDEVLLVGGQTRTPRVVEVVRDIFGREPNRDRNPDEVVGIGAAIQSGILLGEVKDMVLLDVIPLSLGIETRGGTFTRLLERGSTIPTRKSKIFTTVTDNQSKVEVHVLQGEREIAARNKSLGKFELVGVPPAPKGVPQIEVSFDIDSNGIVHVSAKDLASGKEQRVVVNPSGGLTEAEIQNLVREAQQHAEEDRLQAELARVRARVEGLLESNEKTFKEFGNLLEEEKRKKVQEILAATRRGLQSTSAKEVSDSMEGLGEASQILSEVILYRPAAGAPAMEEGGQGGGEGEGAS